MPLGELPEAASVHGVWRPLPSAGEFPGVVWHQRPHPPQLTASSTSASTWCHHTGQFLSTPQRVRDKRELQVLQLVGPELQKLLKKVRSLCKLTHQNKGPTTQPKRTGWVPGWQVRMTAAAAESAEGQDAVEPGLPSQRSPHTVVAASSSGRPACKPPRAL